ncbi:molecular chaperone [Amycolatopsis orientalis]|uniref:Molecular chaperone n=1 Tax=Amycolatopsis orientalis TaxID=31958 RepID=A0A193BVC7_AMYOR|nr:SMR family transporter [Amycolatopsis orientalis]ANN16124.1 molecular chaperone [Amycolatopsis orientalis]
MHWLYLGIAIVFEVAFIFGARAAKGFTKLWPSVFSIACSAIVIYLLSLVMLDIDVAVAYTILIGGGTIGAIVFGRLFLRERVTPVRMTCFVFIVLGIAGLHMTVGA